MKKYEIFVATNGNDQNDGSIEHPLASLEAAKRKARTLRGRGEIAVNIRGGEYLVRNTVSFTSEDGGSAQSPIVYRAYNGERVSFVGGAKIPKERMSRVTDEKILSRLIDKTAREKICQIDLSGYMDYIPPEFNWSSDWRCHAPNYFYENGRIMELARYPKHTAVNGSIGEFAIMERYEVDEKTKIYMDSDTVSRMKLWDKSVADNLRIFGFFVHGWSVDYARVTEVNADGGYVCAEEFSVYKPKTSKEPIAKPCYFYNILDELSLGGEYYVDRENEKMYFIPTKSLDETEIYLPTLEGVMFDFGIDARFIRLEGFDIRFVRESAISMLDTLGVEIADCEFSCGVKCSVQLRRAFNTKISGCRFHELGSGMLTTEYVGEKNKLRDGGLIVENCEMHDVAKLKVCYTGLNLGWETSGAIIRNNKFYNSPHLLVGFRNTTEVLVENNEFYNAVLDCDDAAVIYWGADVASVGITIRNNYFHDWGNDRATWGNACIYTDGGTAAHIYNNVFERCGRPEIEEFATVKAHSESFLQLHNNIFITGALYHKLGTWDNACNFGIAEWLPHALGAHSRKGYDRLYDMLSVAGFFTDAWRKKYKDTPWGEMYKIISAENVSRVQGEIERAINEGATEEVANARAMLVGMEIAWNHKLPDGSIYEGGFLEYVEKELPDVYNKAMAEVEGQGELERLERLALLVLEVMWFGYLTPTDTVRSYANIAIGTLPKHVAENGKIKLGNYQADTELLLDTPEIDGKYMFTNDKDFILTDEAKAYIAKHLPDFVPFDLSDVGIKR
ncbi:MAG: right-handed parallel beta-helix repeat-containing protein [Clostridia bacterium]|nr:right-handed parallel beta-helix repeat-containing protein [Clostridia bacterium]